MSGILDNKSRIIDAILTFEGRRQMATGDFVVKYVTFSDKNIVYKPDLQEGHVDPTNKIYLETFNSPYDQIIFESDDSGNLVSFRQHAVTDPTSTTGSLAWNSFIGGQLKSRLQLLEFLSTGSFISGSNTIPGYSETNIVGTDFSSKIEGILASSFDNFNNLRAIGSFDNIFDNQDFALSANEISFNIPNTAKFSSLSVPTSVNTIDSFFNDNKLRNIDNFNYLPPIVAGGVQDQLGNYPAWGPTNKLTFEDIKNEVEDCEYKTVYFDPTSTDNNLVIQIFEITNDKASKLDVIDYGKVNNISQNSLSNTTNHIFFVGKIVVDESEQQCFINLFTLIFSSMGEE
jgi:hypothetical protein